MYCHAGLFVIPSYYEGLPLVLLEALSYGLSCIASDIPANRNFELPNNRFFRAGNAKELSSKIKEFVHRPLTETEKESQRTLLARKFDWEKIADRTLEVYKSVVYGKN
jgi:glycosyltransferase involved in cell wall biosynthesis